MINPDAISAMESQMSAESISKSNKIFEKEMRKLSKIKMCTSCGMHPVDLPSKQCIGCDSYLEHLV